MSTNTPFRSGFINIIGLPNAGKSTLLNALVGEHLAITTPKVQTTRHRILGIVTGPDFQAVFSDTPGFISEPHYALHQSMNKAIAEALEDADVLVLLIDARANGQPEAFHLALLNRIQATATPVIVALNKVDLIDSKALEPLAALWQEALPKAAITPLSATEGFGVPELFRLITGKLPENPAYFPEEQLTDRHVRFFVAELIRQQILLQYRQEVPYSIEVQIEAYEEGEGDDIDRIRAIIFVNRKTQKPILIGKGGEAIKRLGIASRRAIEALVGKQVFLELHVKVREDWRDNNSLLERFGYH